MWFHRVCGSGPRQHGRAKEKLIKGPWAGKEEKHLIICILCHLTWKGLKHLQIYYH